MDRATELCDYSLFAFRRFTAGALCVAALAITGTLAALSITLQTQRGIWIDTGDLIYARLHGPKAAYTGSYRAPRLRVWVDRAKAWKKRGKTAFLFFDNDEKGYAVKNGTRTIGLLKAA